MNLRRMLINYTSLNPTSNLAYSTNDIPERPPRMWDTVVFCLSDVDGPHLRLAKMRAEEVTLAVIEEHRKKISVQPAGVYVLEAIMDGVLQRSVKYVDSWHIYLKRNSAVRPPSMGNENQNRFAEN